MNASLVIIVLMVVLVAVQGVCPSTEKSVTAAAPPGPFKWCRSVERDCAGNNIGDSKFYPNGYLPHSQNILYEVYGKCKKDCHNTKNCRSFRTDKKAQLCWLKSKACTYAEQQPKTGGKYYVKLSPGESCDDYKGV